MERLTVKHYLGSDYYMKCSEECNVDMDCIDCPVFEKLVDRLGAYEDTGLGPEAVKGMQYRQIMRVINIAPELEGVPFDRLRELAQYGPEAQSWMLVEEVAELILAICKHRRGADNLDNIAEEIADVGIMLDQMRLLFNVEARSRDIRVEKVARLAERMDAG